MLGHMRCWPSESLPLPSQAWLFHACITSRHLCQHPWLLGIQALQIAGPQFKPLSWEEKNSPNLLNASWLQNFHASTLQESAELRPKACMNLKNAAFRRWIQTEPFSCTDRLSDSWGPKSFPRWHPFGPVAKLMFSLGDGQHIEKEPSIYIDILGLMLTCCKSHRRDLRLKGLPDRLTQKKQTWEAHLSAASRKSRFSPAMPRHSAGPRKGFLSLLPSPNFMSFHLNLAAQ